MFTEKVNPILEPQEIAGKRRGRGRPPGMTAGGLEARQRLYDTAIKLITKKGYEATTLRDVAEAAGVTVGLLYKYFPSKRSVVLALYDDLSAEFADRAANMQAGKWRERFLSALDMSLEVLGSHRNTLSALVSVLVGDREEGLFAPGTAFSRRRVLTIFHQAVAGASDAPPPELAASLGRLLYLVHLAIILWWLLDKSPRQRATKGLVKLLQKVLPASALALRLQRVRAFVLAGDILFREALFDDTETFTPHSLRRI